MLPLWFSNASNLTEIEGKLKRDTVLIVEGTKEKDENKKLIKSIKLYLQEIQVIHSVRKKAFKAHSKMMHSENLKGISSLSCTVHVKHAISFPLFYCRLKGCRLREGTLPRGGPEASLGGSKTASFPPIILQTQ